VSADQFLAQVVTVLGAAVLVVVVSVRLRAPSIVGLILAGMLIGPTGLGLVHETELVEILAEIGVVLLLFLIGLELSVSRLRELARPFLLGGGSQAVLTMAGGFVLAMSWSSTTPQQLFLAMVVTLSSTAIVLKIYNERHETDTAQGKAALGVLLFQDFLIVPMIVLTPVIAGATDVSFGAFALKVK
jgi:CPA2 family monovalent cation:H+ antiporter-2